jgi:hypothetical protein
MLVKILIFIGLLYFLNKASTYNLLDEIECLQLELEMLTNENKYLNDMVGLLTEVPKDENETP